MSQSLLKQTVKNSSFSTAGTAAVFVIALLFAGFRIRLLGVERAGFIMLIESVLGMTTIIGGFGFGTAAIRKIAVFYEQEKFKAIQTTLNVVLFVNLLIGVLFVTAMISGFNWIFQWSRTSEVFQADAYTATIFIGLSFFVQQLFRTYGVTFSALQRYDIIALLNSIFGFLNGGLGLLTLMLFPTMTALALLSFLLALLRAVVTIFIVCRLIGGIVVPKWNFVELRSMAGFGGWAYLGSLSRLLMNGMDKMVLTAFLGSQSLPYYVFGQKLVQRIHTFLAGQSQFLFPMLASQGDRVEVVVRQVEDRLRWFVAFLSAIIYGGFIAMAYPLLLVLVGEGFARIAVIPFILACLQGFLRGLNIVPYHISWAGGHGAPNAVMTFVAGVLVIGTVALLTPHFGIVGASMAKLWVGVTSLAWIYWVDRLNNNVSLWGMFRPLISPVIVLITLFIGSGIAWNIWGRDWILYFEIVGITGIFAVLAGILIESRLFQKYRCFETVKSAAGIFFNYIAMIRRRFLHSEH